MRRTRALLLVPALLFLPVKAFVFSQEAKPAAFSSAEHTLYQGEMKAISVNTPTRVVIGKPEIADVISVSTKELVVVGKGAGMTNLIWWDESGEHHAGIKVLTEAMAYINSRIQALIKELKLPNISTQPSDSEGKVLLLGTVRSKEEMERVRAALGGLFPRTTNLIQIDEEKAIIELEVEIIEVDKGSTKDMGMDWLLSGASTEFTEPLRWNKFESIPDSLFRISEWTHEQLTATLNLLVEEGKARILSRPKLACQSGKEAELMVGGEKPIMTTQVVSGTTGTSNTVDYKEYGIKLKMSPALNPDGKIKLGLNVEVSDVGDAEVLGMINAPTAKAWPLIKRSTSTQLYLNNGQTLAISGLIKQKTEEQLKKFPWLGDVPILGVFFRNRTTMKGSGNDTMGDTELVIMVTPAVVEDNKNPKKSEAEKKSPNKPGKDQVAASEQGSVKSGSASKTVPQSKVSKIAANKAESGVVVTPKKTFAKARPQAAAAAVPGGNRSGQVKAAAKEQVSGGGKVSPARSSPKSGAQAVSGGPDRNQAGKDALVSRNKNTQAGISSQQGFPGMSSEVAPRTPAEEYIQLVIEYLSENIAYPWAAKQGELEGTVVINLHLASSGDLLESNVGDTSGLSILDENSMSAARRITPYPAFLKEMSEEDIWLQIPIFYNLQEKKWPEQ